MRTGLKLSRSMYMYKRMGISLIFTVITIELVLHVFLTLQSRSTGVKWNELTFKLRRGGESGENDMEEQWPLGFFNQLKLLPNSVKLEWEKPVANQRKKRVVIIDTTLYDPMKNDAVFDRFRCPVAQCTFSTNTTTASLESAEAILLRENFFRPTHIRPPNQIWALLLMESPFHSPDLNGLRGDINWTASYRIDSTIHIPYGVFRRFPITRYKGNNVNYASGKTRQVAWVVTHCNAWSGRDTYAKELAKFIKVDKYGDCAEGNCSRDPTKSCFNTFKRHHKFYLAFENSRCRNYITEKIYVNAFEFNMVPVVMGAPIEDYEKFAPPNSFIHVDSFPSPKDLAEYLHQVDKNDTLYNSYFKWKDQGEVFSAYNYGFYCRFCAMLWSDRPPTWYDDVNQWWRKKGLCRGRYPDNTYV